MNCLIYILITFFVCLIGYQIFLAFSKKPLIEGLEGEEGEGEEDVVSSESTDPNATTTTDTTTTTTSELTYQPYQGGSTADNALALSKQNQYNIEYLNSEVKKIGGMSNDIDKMKQDIDQLTDSVTSLAESAADLGNSITGGDDAATTTDELGNITGLGSADPNDQTEEAIAAMDAGEEDEEPQPISL